MNTHAFPQNAVPTELLAQIGATLASAVVRLQGGGASGLDFELQQLETLGLQLQAVARMLEAPGDARPESVDLGVAAQQARAEWADAFRRAGAHWDGPATGTVAVVNPAVLKQLLDLALAHALGVGRRIEVEIPHGTLFQPTGLRLCVRRDDGAALAVPPGDTTELHWALLALLARHAGVTAERQTEPGQVTLSLRFPPLGALESAALPEPTMLPSSVLPAGCRILLLEPHEPTRVQAERLMLKAGLQVRAVSSLDEAESAVQQSLPDGLVTGIPTAQPRCHALLEGLRARQPGLRVLELSPEANVFAISLPGSGQPAQLARADLDRYLVSALAQELSAQW